MRSKLTVLVGVLAFAITTGYALNSVYGNDGHAKGCGHSGCGVDKAMVAPAVDRTAAEPKSCSTEKTSAACPVTGAVFSRTAKAEKAPCGVAKASDACPETCTKDPATCSVAKSAEGPACGAVAGCPYAAAVTAAADKSEKSGCGDKESSTGCSSKKGVVDAVEEVKKDPAPATSVAMAGSH